MRLRKKHVGTMPPLAWKPSLELCTGNELALMRLRAYKCARNLRLYAFGCRLMYWREYAHLSSRKSVHPPFRRYIPAGGLTHFGTPFWDYLPLDWKPHLESSRIGFSTPRALLLLVIYPLMHFHTPQTPATYPNRTLTPTLHPPMPPKPHTYIPHKPTLCKPTDLISHP